MHIKSMAPFEPPSRSNAKTCFGSNLCVCKSPLLLFFFIIFLLLVIIVLFIIILSIRHRLTQRLESFLSSPLAQAHTTNPTHTQNKNSPCTS